MSARERRPDRRGGRAPEVRLVRPLAHLIAGRYRADVWDDLEAEHAERIGRGQRRLFAWAWLAAEVVRAAVASRWHGWGLSGAARVDLEPRRRRNVSDRIRQDLAWAARSLVRAPLFTLAAVLTLTLGLGATFAVYTVVSGVLLRPLPYEASERLVLVRGGETGRWAITYPDYADIAETGRASFGALAAWQGWSVIVEDDEGIPTRRVAASVSWRFFDLLGARPAAGRLFTAADGAPGHTPVVVLSHASWLRDFGGAAGAIGRSYPMDGVAYTIVGVAPRGFIDPVAYATWGNEPEMWRADPPVFSRTEADRDWIGFWAIGRLREGARPERAQAHVDAVVRAAYPDAENRPEARVVGLLDATVEGIRPTLLVLLGAGVLVLLIACVNVANLLLSRGSVRGREIAVRTALGASRGRLVAQLLTESVLLSALAGAGGLIVAAAGARVLVAGAGAQLPRAWDVAVDWRVGAVAFGVSVLTALLFGLAPALQATGRAAPGLREGRGATGDRGGHRVRALLVVAETALAVMLLVGAGLLLRTLWTLQRVDPGFDTEAAVAVRIGLPDVTFPTAAEQVQGLERVVAEVASAPGVVAAGAITDLPMGGAINSTTIFRDDLPPPDPEQRRSALVRAIVPGYFETMRVPLVRGRDVEPGDHAAALPVAVVNAHFADVFFPGEDPVGRSVTVRGVSRRIVGIVADVKEFTLDGGPDPVLYEPFAQEGQSWMRANVWVLARGGPDLTALVRAAVRRAHAGVPIGTVRTLDELIADHVAGPRLRALLIILFGVLALALAAVGVAGVMAYAVSRRSREFGVRLAVGATRADVMGLVAADAARITVAGVVLGLLGAAAGTRLIAGFLFGVPPFDPVVFGAVAATLALVGMAASILPARRAAAVDPNTVLRGD